MSDQELTETNAAEVESADVARSDVVVPDVVVPDVVVPDVAHDDRTIDVTGAVSDAADSEDFDVEDTVIGPAEARRAVEAMLMVADQPVPTATISQVLDLSVQTVLELCSEMTGDYEALGHGFQLVMVAGGWRFQSHPRQAKYVERFVLDGQVSRLSAAALETLAIVAYKQPISRAQIAQIRGVNVDGVMRTLAQRGYVAEIGTDPGPGQASLFGTTTKFLEGVGLGSVADLAPLADFVPGSEIMEALEAGLRVDTTIDTSLDTPAEVPSTGQTNPDPKPFELQPVTMHDSVG
jgi:segregation and condensation protein B